MDLAANEEAAGSLWVICGSAICRTGQQAGSVRAKTFCGPVYHA